MLFNFVLVGRCNESVQQLFVDISCEDIRRVTVVVITEAGCNKVDC